MIQKRNSENSPSRLNKSISPIVRRDINDATKLAKINDAESFDFSN